LTQISSITKTKVLPHKFLGKEKVGERDCYKVELTKNVNKTVYYFDVQNFLLVKRRKERRNIGVF
jgi:hypothetical protein